MILVMRVLSFGLWESNVWLNDFSLQLCLKFAMCVIKYHCLLFILLKIEEKKHFHFLFITVKLVLTPFVLLKKCGVLR